MAVDIETRKVSELPSSEDVKGLFTLGVSGDSQSVKVPLGRILSKKVEDEVSKQVTEAVVDQTMLREEIDRATKAETKNANAISELSKKLKAEEERAIESELENADKIALKANAKDTYTKKEVDDRVNKKANTADVYSKAVTYTKVEIDAKLNNKAERADVYTTDNTYSKTEVNNLLSQKASVTQLNLKANTSQVYTRQQMDSLLADKANKDGVASKESVQDLLDKVKQEIEDRKTAISETSSTMQAENALLRQMILNNSNALTTETQERKQADRELRDDLNKEITRATNAENGIIASKADGLYITDIMINEELA